VYAVVRSGGRQHKVTVGDVLEVDRIHQAAGASVALVPLLLVDGTSVTAEVLAETKGPKIRIMKFKNKTGYRKRQGHRQKHTQIRITGIES
jgi:large subunit ribosomal protein L21